jgi:hypothetical protein
LICGVQITCQGTRTKAFLNYEPDGGTRTELLSGTFGEKLFPIMIFLPILILKLILTKTYPPSITHLPHKYRMGGKPPPKGEHSQYEPKLERIKSRMDRGA